MSKVETKSVLAFWQDKWNNRGLLDVTTANFVEATIVKLTELQTIEANGYYLKGERKKRPDLIITDKGGITNGN